MDSANTASNQTSTSADNDDFDDEDDVHSQAHLSSLQTFLPPPASIASSSSIFDAFSPYFTPFPFPPPPPPPQPEAASLSFDATWKWNSPASAAALSPPPQPQFSTPAPAAAAPSQTPPRGSRKRARASRRPATTVINTETSNFRAMVQQFTGFPTPPFAAATFPARPRLELFGASAAGVVPPFLLRPSAHKLIPSPSSSSSSSSASRFDHAIASIARSHLSTTIGATPDPSNSIPPKYHDHDKFNLSLFDNNMQRAGEATFAAPPFLQPPQQQMVPPPPPPPVPEATFPSDSASMNPRWHVEDQESERQNAELARSKFHFRNFHHNQN